LQEKLKEKEGALLPGRLQNPKRILKLGDIEGTDLCKI
jgi:hypothetical protein